MRTLPDSLTCTTTEGGFSSSLDVPKALVRSDIWFPDGNIVLIAGSAAFKVHRGQLARHSDVFKDMFLVGRAGTAPSKKVALCRGGTTVHEEGNKLVDGCPTVDIYDCPSDVYHLLVALYDGLYFANPHARDFSTLSSVLRLSTKYFIEHLRTQCLARLLHDWPTTLADWDRREAAVTDARGRYTPRHTYADPVLAINLALELGIPDILPSAFYDLSRYGPSRIVSGVRALPSAFPSPDPCALRPDSPVPATSSSSGPLIHLSHDCVVRTLKGRELAQLYISTFLTRALEHRPSGSCLYAAAAAAGNSNDEGDGDGDAPSSGPIGHCDDSFYFIHLNILRSVGGVAFGRDADPLFTLLQAAEMLERRDFTDGVRLYGLKMCRVCRREWRWEVARAREEVWALIPVWFGLKEGGAVDSEHPETEERVQEDEERDVFDSEEDTELDIDMGDLG